MFAFSNEREFSSILAVDYLNKCGRSTFDLIESENNRSEIETRQREEEKQTIIGQITARVLGLGDTSW